MTGEEVYAYIKRSFPHSEQRSKIYDAITDTILDIKLQLKVDNYKAETTITGISALGDYKLNLPDDFAHLIGDVIFQKDSTTSYPLLKRSKEKFDELYPYPTADDVDKSQPVDYCIFAGQVYIGPVPDSVDYSYKISYTTEANVQVDSSTANVPFSTYNRELLKFGALFRLYSGLETDISLNASDEQRYLRKDVETLKWGRLYKEALEKFALKESRNTEGITAIVYQDI